MSASRTKFCENTAATDINRCDFLYECLKSFQQFESHPFPRLPDVDEGKVENVYEKPTPLYMGKFVSDIINSEQTELLAINEKPQSDQDIKLNKRIVTEKALPIVFSENSVDKKCVRYTIWKQPGCLENLPEYVIFSAVRFRKKSDASALRALWKPTCERKYKSCNDALQTRPVDVQFDNADTLCLYKMGPGVVAFRVVITTFHAGGLRHTIDGNWNLFWGKRIGEEEWKRASVYQKVNHFPGSKNIGRKDLLHWNILKARKAYPTDYDFSPPTFVLPHEALMFQKYRIRHGQEDQTYIVKPVASSCGKGIYLTSSISIPWRHKKSIVQQYIPQPLLIDGRKFDLRIYVALTSIQPLRLYVFDDGLVRLSPEAYPGDTNDLTSIHKHVTNYSINKHCVTSEGAEIKWNLTRLKNWLAANYSDGKKKWADLQNSIESIVVKTFAAIGPEIIRQGKIHMPHDTRMQGCFELFGFDLLLNTSFKMFLLEVNIMPSLATESDIDIDVKSKLLADLLCLVGIAAYDRKSALQQSNLAARHTGCTDGQEELITRVLETDSFQHIFQCQMGKALLETIIQSENELRRCGGFRRVFPTKKSYERYGHLFEDKPDLTHFMMYWEQQHG